MLETLRKQTLEALAGIAWLANIVATILADALTCGPGDVRQELREEFFLALRGPLDEIKTNAVSLPPE